MFNNLLIRSTCAVALAFATVTAPLVAQATANTPEALVSQISAEVIATAKNDAAIQAGDLNRIIQLVDTTVLPHVNFEVMTRSAVGPQWRQATAAQRSKLQDEFKVLLVRVYAGAMTEVKDQNIEVLKTLPVGGSTQVVVQTEVRGKGAPIKLDYRMDKPADAAAWKIIDVNVAGIWLVQSYRSQFATEISKGGIDGLIAALVQRNSSKS